MTLSRKAVLLVVAILIVDQVSKIIVKTQMSLGESIPVFGDWFYIRFIENPGMAFGIDIPGDLGKPILTIFRIVAVVLISIYIKNSIKKGAPAGFVLFMSMVLAGALGNIFDSLFYGLIFSESTYFGVAEYMPPDGGYAPFLYGHVVDMFYFPLIEGVYPEWIPFKGGESFLFFRPIFNVADSAISVGVICILLFQRGYLKENS